MAVADHDGGWLMGAVFRRARCTRAIEEVMMVEFRRRTLLPLDDVLGCLQDSIRSSPSQTT
jgi:hypothetical protein